MVLFLRICSTALFVSAVRSLYYKCTNNPNCNGMFALVLFSDKFNHPKPLMKLYKPRALTWDFKVCRNFPGSPVHHKSQNTDHSLYKKSHILVEVQILPTNY